MVECQDIFSSLSAGVGYALMHGLLIYGSVISYAGGPGTLFSDNCPDISSYIVSSLTAAGFGILDICLMVKLLLGNKNLSSINTQYHTRLNYTTNEYKGNSIRCL